MICRARDHPKIELRISLICPGFFLRKRMLIRIFRLWLFRDKKHGDDIEISVSSNQAPEEGLILTTKNPATIQRVQTGALRHVGNLGSLKVLRPNQSSIHLPPAVFSSHPSDPVQDAIDYNRVILKRGKKKVEELLKQIDDRVEAIEAVRTTQRPLIYADIGLPEMIPVTHLGEGFCRLLDIYSELIAGDTKVLLVDEVENGLHHTVMPTVWTTNLIRIRNRMCKFLQQRIAPNASLRQIRRRRGKQVRRVESYPIGSRRRANQSDHYRTKGPSNCERI